MSSPSCGPTPIALVRNAFRPRWRRSRIAVSMRCHAADSITTRIEGLSFKATCLTTTGRFTSSSLPPVQEGAMTNAALAAIDLALARSVLRTEAEAVLGLIDRLDERFEEAVRLLLACRGRVIVTGMGKSGLVSRKIAATLSSTGTPALFLHPAEAVHGDLGMIVRGDVVMALSLSGETEEIIELIPTMKRLDVKLVAMTGELRSTLAQTANVPRDCS